jgi:Uma2 family endonuclease
MATQSESSLIDWTVADVFDRLGPIPARRIRSDPSPGTATEQDVVEIHDREKRLYELVDGILVEKTTGIDESYLAVLIARFLSEFVEARGLGMILGADGMARLSPGLIRIPDVSFISWARIGARRVPSGPFLRVAPDLAVEVLSPSNTAKEMSQKLIDYFQSGVRLVWYIDPRARSLEVFTAVDRSVVIGAGGTINGGDVLPELVLPLDRLFAEPMGPAQPSAKGV